MLLKDLVDSFEGLIKLVFRYDLVTIPVHAGKIEKVEREDVVNFPAANHHPRFATVQIVSLR